MRQGRRRIARARVDSVDKMDRSRTRTLGPGVLEQRIKAQSASVLETLTP